MIPTDARQRWNMLCFLLAVGCLAATAVGLHAFRDRLVLVKKPLPIRKFLRDFDRSVLKPFVFLSSRTLPEETIMELGTDEYADWRINLPGDQHPWRGPVNFFLTYYTGKQDQIPHVPEECFYQGAFTPAGDETLTLDLPLFGESVAIRRLAFYPPGQVKVKSYVYYVISVNGSFHTRRDSARVKMGDPRDTHLYYAKVEIALEAVDDARLAEVDEHIRGLLDRTLTELQRSHWPPRGWERGGPVAPEAGSTTGPTPD